MIRVGIVGFGFMGRMHYRCWRNLPGVQVAAICESNPAAIDAAKAGNIAGAADAIDLSDVTIFNDFDALLQSDTVDAVSITLPTFLHADLTVRALEGGLHVLCEKPMALNVPDCDRMIAAAKQTGKCLQIGHCIRFWPEYEWTRHAIQTGKYGATLAASFRRLGAAPAWGANDWFSNEKRSGGMVMDLHCHDSDFIQQVWGLPAAVHSVGNSELSHLSTQYMYGLPMAITAEGSWRMAKGFGFEMSFNIVLERSSIIYDSTRQPSFRVIPNDGEKFTPELPPGDGYRRQLAHFLQRIEGLPVEDVVSLEQSRETIRLVIAERDSARSGRKVEL